MVAKQPGNQAALHNLAYAYKLMGSYEDALRLFEGIVARDPINVRATYELGDCYHFAGQLEKARATYSRVLELDPDHGWARLRLRELAD